MTEIIKYPFDPTGVALTNAVIGEEHVVELDGARVIVPQNAPFYTKGLIVKTDGGQTLVKGIDYKPIHFYMEASLATGLEVVAAIAFLKSEFADTVHLDYQVVGGEYSTSKDALAEVINNLSQIDQTTSWDDILNKPEFYPAEDHDHNARDMIGMSETVAALTGIVDAIRATADRNHSSYGEQLANAVTMKGHRKLITDKGAIALVQYKGPLELIFERGPSNSNQLMLEIQVLDSSGAATYYVSGNEGRNGDVYLESSVSGEEVVANGFYARKFSVGGQGKNDVVVSLYSIGDGQNRVVLGDINTEWRNCFVNVNALTVNGPDINSYNTVWSWSDSALSVAPPGTLPGSADAGNHTHTMGDVDGLIAALQSIQNSLGVAIAHVNADGNVHSMTAGDLGLSKVMNWDPSSDYADNSLNKYATISAVHGLYQAIVDAGMLSTGGEGQASSNTDVTTAIVTTMNRGVTF